MVRVWLCIALATGCSGSPKQTAGPAPAEPSCRRTAEHMIDELVAGKDPRPPDDVVNANIQMIQQRCEADGWTVQARDCLAKMTSTQEAEACAAMLTKEQQDALIRDQEQALERRMREGATLRGENP